MKIISFACLILPAWCFAIPAGEHHRAETQGSSVDSHPYRFSLGLATVPYLHGSSKGFDWFSIALSYALDAKQRLEVGILELDRFLQPSDGRSALGSEFSYIRRFPSLEVLSRGVVPVAAIGVGALYQRNAESTQDTHFTPVLSAKTGIEVPVAGSFSLLLRQECYFVPRLFEERNDWMLGIGGYGVWTFGE